MPTGGLYDNLYAYYKCDEASGTLIDASGNTRNIAVNTGAPGTAAGVVSTSRSFPGTTAYFMAGTNALFSPASSHFSFSFWLYLTNTAQSGNDTGILSKATAAATYEWLVWYSPTAPFKMKLGASSDGLGGANFKGVVEPTTMNATTWYFVAGGWDGTNLWLSLNGAARTNAAFAGPCFHTTDQLTIGIELGSAGPLNGRVDEIGFWMPRDLTAAEVTRLYNSGAGLAYEGLGAGLSTTSTGIVGQYQKHFA